MGMIRAGNLDRVVTLVRAAADEDDGLEELPGGWLKLGTRRASIKPVFVAERFESAGQEAKREYSAWLRYDSLTAALTAQDAVVDDSGRLFELTGEPEELGRREGIALRMKAADPAVQIDVSALVLAT